MGIYEGAHTTNEKKGIAAYPKLNSTEFPSPLDNTTHITHEDDEGGTRSGITPGGANHPFNCGPTPEKHAFPNIG